MGDGQLLQLNPADGVHVKVEAALDVAASAVLFPALIVTSCPAFTVGNSNMTESVAVWPEVSFTVTINVVVLDTQVYPGLALLEVNPGGTEVHV